MFYKLKKGNLVLSCSRPLGWASGGVTLNTITSTAALWRISLHVEKTILKVAFQNHINNSLNKDANHSQSEKKRSAKWRHQGLHSDSDLALQRMSTLLSVESCSLPFLEIRASSSLPPAFSSRFYSIEEKWSLERWPGHCFPALAICRPKCSVGRA